MTIRQNSLVSGVDDVDIIAVVVAFIPFNVFQCFAR